MPIVTASGPDIVTAELRCAEYGNEDGALQPQMRLVLGVPFSTDESNLEGGAAVMVSSSRMFFELQRARHTELGDTVYARDGQEDAMRSICDGALVSLLDVRVKTPEGTTTVPTLRVQPAWH